MLKVTVFGDIIIVKDQATQYYALYGRPTTPTALAAHGLVQDLTLLRRGPTTDLTLIARAHDAALIRAREIGWTV
jgi:hypothetical protein